MSDDQPQGRTTELGDEGLELRAGGLALLYPEGWEARVDGTTAILTGPAPSSAFVMVQRLGLPLPPAAREALARSSRAGLADGLVSGLDGPAELVREEATAATFLGAQRAGQHLTYAGTLDGAEVTLTVDLFTAGLDTDTALLVVASRDEDRDAAVTAFALVTATLAFDA